MKGEADLLVVEDEPVLVGAIRKVCEYEGLSVDEAVGTEDGLARLASNRYRIVVTDLMLPGVGGLGLLDFVRRERPQTPVVVITGFATCERILTCFERGAFDVVPKPFDMPEILASVRRALAFAVLGESERRSPRFEEWATPPTGGDTPAGLFSLGQHAWVRFATEGSVEIGVAESFHGIGEVRGIELFSRWNPKRSRPNRCALIETADGLAHRVWAPLSGRIVETNPSWITSAGELQSRIENWMMLVVPTDLENELEMLTRR